MRPRTLVTAAAIVAFIAFLAWSSLEAQKVSCDVCVEYAGRQNCASASHSNENEAVRSAQTTACGPLTKGMNDIIACENRLPVSRQCHAR